MVPIDMKRNLIVVDDLHLESNYKQGVSEYLYSWKQLKGYFDTSIGMFKSISNFTYVATVNNQAKMEKS